MGLRALVRRGRLLENFVGVLEGAAPPPSVPNPSSDWVRTLLRIQNGCRAHCILSRNRSLYAMSDCIHLGSHPLLVAGATQIPPTLLVSGRSR